MNNIKQCQNCQTEAQPGSGFCTNCGERLQKILNCNSCGAQLQQGWKACPDCGNKVQTEQGISEDQARIATVVREKVNVVSGPVTMVDHVNVDHYNGDAETYRRLGDEASNSGDYERAIENYNCAIFHDNRNSTAYNNRAVAYMKMREYESAVQDLGKAISLDPNDANQYSNRGAIHHIMRQYENAITDYGEAIRLNQREANFYAFRGLSYAALAERMERGPEHRSKWEWVKSNFFGEEAQKRASGGEWAAYGRAIKRLGKFFKSGKVSDLVATRDGGEQLELAIQDYIEAIRIEPNIATNPNVTFDYICMAKALEWHKQFSQARKIMDVAISRNPKEVKYYFTRASTLNTIGQPENAMRDLEEAFRIDPKVAKNEHIIAFYNVCKQSAASGVSGPQ